MKKLLLLLVLAAAIQRSEAQTANIKFNYFGITDGLPERVIQSIFQDSQGYIRMGTQNGLVRNDGYKPKLYIFGIDKNAHAPNCSVETMVENNNHELWVPNRQISLQNLQLRFLYHENI